MEVKDFIIEMVRQTMTTHLVLGIKQGWIYIPLERLHSPSGEAVRFSPVARGVDESCLAFNQEKDKIAFEAEIHLNGHNSEIDSYDSVGKAVDCEIYPEEDKLLVIIDLDDVSISAYIFPQS